MKNRFKLKISRMFRSSFGACRIRKISDDIVKPILSPQNNDSFHLVEPFPSPPSRAAAINGHRQTRPRRKSSARHTRFAVSAADFDGRRKCPPPTKPLNRFLDCKEFGFYEKKKSLPRNKNKKKRKNTKRVHVKRKYLSSQETATYTDTNNTYYHGTGWWFSSEDDETENFFSSRTRSSDSSESLKNQHSDCRKMRKTRRRRAKKTGVGALPLGLGRN